MTQAAFKSSCYFAPPGLQHWLQFTYEVEQKNYDKKKVAAEKQLQQAREAVSNIFSVYTKIRFNIIIIIE